VAWSEIDGIRSLAKDRHLIQTPFYSLVTIQNFSDAPINELYLEFEPLDISNLPRHALYVGDVAPCEQLTIQTPDVGEVAKAFFSDPVGSWTREGSKLAKEGPPPSELAKLASYQHLYGSELWVFPLRGGDPTDSQDGYQARLKKRGSVQACGS
jgi:hypothetical protein